MTTNLITWALVALISTISALSGLIIFHSPIYRLFGKNGHAIADKIILKSCLIFSYSTIGIFVSLFEIYH